MTKATATAHPIQGLLKYHGLRDPKLRIPLHDSISVCVAPYETRTTIELRPDQNKDIFEIDGQVATGRAHERALDIINHIRQRSAYKDRVYMRSENNFLSNIGLGASSSGFAALAVAGAAAFDLGLNSHQLSAIARLGAGSATRSVSGYYSHWYSGEDHDTSYAEAIASDKTLPMGIVMAIIPAYKNTDNAHQEALTSPFLPCRIAHAKAQLDEIRKAIIEGDFSTVGWLAERDSLSLHAATMTAETAPLYWQPETVQVIHEVRRLRAEGLECYFSIDTGATVYINSRPADVEAVASTISALGIETAIGHVGGPSRLTDEHLF